MADILPTDVTNKNFINANSFRFQLKRTPHLNYFCQTTPLPSLSQNALEYHFPMNKYHFTGKKLQYEPLTLTFKVDEDLKNWIEIHDWLIGLTSPQDTRQYREWLKINQGERYQKIQTYQHNAISDGTLFILTNALNVNFAIEFVDMFPISLSNIDFSTMDTDHPTASVTFVYDYFKFAV